MIKKCLLVFFMIFALLFAVACAEDNKEDNNDNKQNEAIHEYIVTFVVDGKKTEVKVKDGEKVSKPSDPVKEGYTFVGWFVADKEYDFGAVKADLEVTAKFKEAKPEVKEYTVKFVVNGDEETVVVEEGEKVAKPQDPVKDGYNFLGWYVNEEVYDFESIVNSNLIIEAKFEAIKFTVTFVVNDVMTEVEVLYGETVIKPSDPNKDGFEFVGWFIDDIEYDFGVVTEDIKLYAIFKEIIIYHTVTFIDEDNNEIGVITVKHGDSILEEDYPKVEGFTLVNMSHDLKNIDKDLTVKCEFKQLYNVVIYDTKGSVYKNMQVPRGETLEEIDLSLENDSKFNYSVSDWYTDKELTKRFRLSRPVSYDLELYPRVYATPVNSNYEGLTVSILGDSISTFYSTTSDVNSYYTGDNQFYYPRYSATVKKVTGTWWYQAIESSKTKLGINNSWSGTNLYGTSSSCGMSAERIKTLGDNGTPDIIIIFLGTNDNVNGISASTFKAGYHQAFKQIEMHYPSAYVMCCTLGYSAYTGYNYTEKDRLEYNDVTRDICKQYKAKVIEVAEVQTIDSYTSLLGDNLHPNADGMIKISEKVVKAIDDMFTIGVPIN